MEEERTRFRWSIVLVIAAVALAAWLVKGGEPAGSWKELMAAVGVRRHPDRFVQTAILGLVVVAIVAIARVLRKTEEE